MMPTVTSPKTGILMVEGAMANRDRFCHQLVHRGFDRKVPGR